MWTHVAALLRPVLVVLVALAAVLPAPARGYSTDVHRLLLELAFRQDVGWLQSPTAALREGDLVAFREHVYRRAAAHPDAALRERFVARYPTEADFDAWAFKELLAFHGGAQVVGIDVAPEASTLGELVAGGVEQPDTDWRNRGRLAYRTQAGQRVPMTDALGRPVPFDPALLNLGRLDQLSSQAHAHYGLPQGELSSDPDVLETEPHRFAMPVGFPPGPVLSLAPEMAQMHTDLALLAAVSELERAAELGWLFGAQGWHYTQDVANQIHTIQAGPHEFFVQAHLQYYRRAALTLGGLLGELMPWPAIGIDLLTNYHLLCEELTRKRLLAVYAGRGGPAELRHLLSVAGEDSAELLEALGRGDAGPGGAFALELTRALVELSSVEAAELYRLVHELMDARYAHYGVRFDPERDDVDAALREEAEQSDEAVRFHALQARGLHRALTALRQWRVRFADALVAGKQDPGFADAVLGRLLRQQLDLLDAAEARRAAYLADLPPSHVGPIRDLRFVASAALIVVGLLLAVLGLRRRRRRPG